MLCEFNIIFLFRNYYYLDFLATNLGGVSVRSLSGGGIYGHWRQQHDDDDKMFDHYEATLGHVLGTGWWLAVVSDWSDCWLATDYWSCSYSTTLVRVTTVPVTLISTPRSRSGSCKSHRPWRLHSRLESWGPATTPRVWPCGFSRWLTLGLRCDGSCFLLRR